MKLKSTGYWFCFVFSVQRVAPRCTPWFKNKDRGKVNGLWGSGFEPDPETRSSQPAVSLILLLFHKTL